MHKYACARDRVNALPANALPISTAADANAANAPDQENSSYGTISSPAPAFAPMSSTPFRWGDVMSESLCEDIGKAYENRISGVRTLSLHRLALQGLSL